MKRKYLLVGMLVIGFMAPIVGLLSARACGPYGTEACAPTCGVAVSSAWAVPTVCGKDESDREAAINDKVVKDLIGILKETKSPETFATTTHALGMMGADAKAAVPEIIRNAERLDLLKRGSHAAKEPYTAMVTASLGMILSKNAAPTPYTPVTRYVPVTSYVPAPVSPPPPMPVAPSSVAPLPPIPSATSLAPTTEAR